jgi:two-component sensor histidine kinase
MPRVPRLVVELAVGIILPLVMVALRMPLRGFAGDRAPYAFMFIGIALATVLAGWRSGLIALCIGQALVLFLIIEPTWSWALPEPAVRGGMVLATLSELGIILVLALYQREVDKGMREREQRLALLDDALREIEHRTRNNYQTVLAMVQLQSRRAPDENVRTALHQVADRIQAVAEAAQQLAVHSKGLDAVRLDEHLCGLVSQIERGLSRDGIDVDCDVDEVTASADAATSISIIVNELVTNALKHAFNGESPGHVWVKGKAGSAFELIVADDGRGIKRSPRDGHGGLGSKLIESFARQLGAAHEVTSSEAGTTHRLLIPRLS